MSRRIYLLFTLVLFFYETSLATLPMVSGQSFNKGDTIGPEIDIGISVVGDSVILHITSDEELYTGWITPKLLHMFYNWPTYSCYTRIAYDSGDKIHITAKLYQSPNFYYFKLDNEGKILEEIPEWNGIGNHPIIRDENGKILYIDQVTPLGKDGVTDSEGNSHIVMTGGVGGHDIYYTKVDSGGNVLINIELIDSAQCWVGSAHITIDTNDNLYVIWSKNEYEICYVKSEDRGISWSTINSFGSNPWKEDQPEILCDREGNVHIIWMDQRDNCDLYYRKLYPNGQISVDETTLTVAGSTHVAWHPKFCIDSQNHIHINWRTWYTKIGGNLDKNGASATNAEITLIEDTNIVNMPYGYPKSVADCWDNLHLVTNTGGNPGDDFGLYYQRAVFSPATFIVFPDSSRHKMSHTGSGTDWYTRLEPPMSGTYYVYVAGSDSVGNMGYADTFFIWPPRVEEKSKVQSPKFKVYPNPFYEKTVIRYSLPVNRNNDYPITLKQVQGFRLTIYDVTGRVVRAFNHLTNQTFNQIVWDGRNSEGISVPTGIYICKLEVGHYTMSKGISLLRY